MTPAPRPPAQWPAHRRDPSPGQGRHRAVTPRRTRLRVRPAALAAAACLAAGMALMPYTLASPTGSLADEQPVFPWLSLPAAAADEPPVETSAVVEVAEETVTEPEPTVASTTTAATPTAVTTTEEAPVTTTQVAAPEGAEDTTTAPGMTSAEPAPVTTTVEPTRPPVSCQEQT